MAPHAEHFTGKYSCEWADYASGGIWEEVPGTTHEEGDHSKQAAKSHRLVGRNPWNYREVGDTLGPACLELQAKNP